MTVKAFLTVIYLGLTVINSAKGQYYPGKPRNIYNPQPQPPGIRFPQQFPQPNTAPGSQYPNLNQNPQQGQLYPDRSRNNFNPPFQPPGNPSLQPARQENFTPRPQSPNFNPSLQGTNPQNIPNFNPFPPSTFPVIPEQSTIIPKRSTFVPLQNNQPTPFPPTVLHNPTYNPQIQNSNFPNPVQNNRTRHGLFFPSSMFSLLSTTPLSSPPQQTGPQNPSPSFLSTPSEIIHPRTLRFIPDSNKPIFTIRQQNRPNPPETAPTVPEFQQTRPLSPQSILPSTAPTGIIDPTPLKLIEDALESDFNVPKQTNPNYNSPQRNIPTPLSPAKSNLGSLTYQQPNQEPSREPQPVIPDSTVPQQPPLDLSVPQPKNTDLTVPQQPPSDSVVPPKTDSGSTIPQQPTSDSIFPQPAPPKQSAPDATVPQQSVPDSTAPLQTDSGLIAPQQTDSDSINPQKSFDASDNIQPTTSASEPISSIPNAPQDSGSESSMSQQPVHTSHNHNLTSQYIPHPENQGNEDPLGGLRIVCLFNNRHFYRNGFTPSKLEPHLCTHLNYEFAILDPKTYEMIVGEPDLDIGMNFYQEATDLKNKNPELKVLVSLGGWSDSTKKYSELAQDPAKRANFVDKAVQFLKGHKFDGMDLAWEYPNCWQGAIGINPSDKQNFVALLKDIKEGLKKEGLLLSVSVGAIKREVEAAYNVPEISKIVDYINVMTYDMHGPWESKTGHHVQFEAKPGDKDPYCNVKGGMKVWIEKGADKKKLNMGLALYGRTYRMKNSNQCEMGAPAVGPGAPGPVTKEGGILNYHEICNFLNSGDWTEKLDRQAGFYACSGDQWAGYDPPMMMVRKVSYVVNSNLGGVLLKDLSGDDSNAECFNMPFPILRMVKMEMLHKVAKKKQKNSKHNV